MNVIGDVKGKDCIIIDDMIDTAGTLVQAAKALKINGARRIYAAATHPVFSDPPLSVFQNAKSWNKSLLPILFHLAKLEEKLVRLKSFLLLTSLLRPSTEHLIMIR